MNIFYESIDKLITCLQNINSGYQMNKISQYYLIAFYTYTMEINISYLNILFLQFKPIRNQKTLSRYLRY